MRIPLLLAVVLLATSAPPATADPSLPDSVRIRILGSVAPDEIEIRAPRYGLTVHSGSLALLVVPADSRLVVRLKDGELYAEGEAQQAQAPAFRVTAGGEPIALRAGDTARSYRGSILLTTDGKAMSLVNTVHLEDYVASVVAAEYALDDLEGTRAMAVVARTYAVRGSGRPGQPWDHEDHESSQVYRGSGGVTQLARVAAEDTRGEVLTFEGQPIQAVYSSSSGGHTASNEDVWNGAPVPYLRGRSDPWDGDSPHHEWTWQVDREELDRLVERRFDAEPRSMEIADRSDDGRATRVRIESRRGKDVTVPAADFRSAVVAAFGPHSVRSTHFDIRRAGGRYEFSGHGFGHGVGLSQWGAHAMALAGKSYREILSFYYRGVLLERRETTSQPPTLAAISAGRPDPARQAPTTAPRRNARTEPSDPARDVRITAWGGRPRAENPSQGRRVGW